MISRLLRGYSIEPGYLHLWYANYSFHANVTVELW